VNRVHKEWFSCDFSQISLFILKWPTLLRIVVMVHIRAARCSRTLVRTFEKVYSPPCQLEHVRCTSRVDDPAAQRG